MEKPAYNSNIPQAWECIMPQNSENNHCMIMGVFKGEDYLGQIIWSFSSVKTPKPAKDSQA